MLYAKSDHNLIESPCLIYLSVHSKSNKRLMVGTITKETKKRKGQKTHSQMVPLMWGSYLTHSSTNVTYMQILKRVIVVDEASFRFGVLLGFPYLSLSNLLHTTKWKV
jgi:hypothetical protein